MARRKKSAGSNMLRNGRSKGASRFWMLQNSMMTSPAFRTLPGSALKVLCEIRWRYDGHNNGKITCSCGELADNLGMSKSTAHKALNVLVDRGFILRTSPGNWYGRQAATWAVTDEPLGASTSPSNEWRRWQPEKQFKRQKVNKVPVGLVPQADIEAELATKNSQRGTVAEPSPR